MPKDSLLLGLRLSLGLALLFFCNTFADDAQPSGDCSSIFLGSLSETNAVHIPSTGVYHSLGDARHNDRPVYQHTNRQTYLYFLLGGRAGQGFWAVGPEVGSGEAEMAFSAGDSYLPVVTQQQWRLWNADSASWSSAVERLKAVCVDDEFGTCTSGRLRIAGISSRNGIQKKRMGLYVLTNRTQNLRPVYRHEGQDEFLFYTNDAGGNWIVGSEVGKLAGGLFVSDFALRPEFIVQTWVVFTGRYLIHDPGVKLQCQGISVGENPSTGTDTEEVPEVVALNGGETSLEGDTKGIPSFPKNRRNVRVIVRGDMEVTECDSTCLHGGHCQRSDPDVYRCICPGHYFGLQCQIDVDCGHPPLVSGQQVVSTTGHYFLDVAFYQCPGNTILDGSPGVICQVDGTWTDPPKCLNGHHLITPLHYDEDNPTISAIP